MPPQLPKGFDAFPPPQIPTTYEGFREWFPQYLRQTLANADVRNATSGSGISVSGDATTNATISVSEEVDSLFGQEFVLIPGATSSELTSYRTLAAEAGITLTDNGARGTLQIGFRESSGTSVVGNPTSGTADNVDILAGADNTVLQRVGGALSFAALPLAAIAAIGASTALANTTAGSAAPTAVPLLGLGTDLARADTNVWTPTVFGSSVPGTTTYTDQTGFYTRVGNLVLFWGHVSWTAATGTGHFIVGGLPFNSANTIDVPVTAYVNFILAVLQAPIILANTNVIEMDQYTSATPPAASQDVPTAGDIFVSGFYPTS